MYISNQPLTNNDLDWKYYSLANYLRILGCKNADISLINYGFDKITFFRSYLTNLKVKNNKMFI